YHWGRCLHAPPGVPCCPAEHYAAAPPPKGKPAPCPPHMSVAEPLPPGDTHYCPEKIVIQPTPRPKTVKQAQVPEPVTSAPCYEEAPVCSGRRPILPRMFHREKKPV